MYYNFFNIKKPWALLFFGCFLFSPEIRAQDKHIIDSLHQLVDRGGKQKINGLVGLAFEYFYSDNQLSLQYSNEAFTLAKDYGDSAQMVKAGRIAGQMLRRMDRLNESIAILDEVYPIAKRNRYMEDYKRILNALAIAHTFKASYDKALEYNFESLVIREAEGDKSEISVALNNIGLVYFKIHSYNQALNYYHRAIQLKKEIRDLADLDRMLINAGLCYNQLGDYNRALEHFTEAYQVCGNNCSNPIRIEAEFGLGVSFYNRKLLDESEEHFNRSFTIAKSEGDKRFQMENLVYLARIYILREDGQKAKTFLEQAEATATGTEYNQLLMDIYKEFSKVFNEIKDFENAAVYQAKYISEYERIHTQELIKNISRIEERQNLATIAAKEEVIKRQRSLNLAIVIIALLSGLLIFVLFRSNLTKKKVNAALSDAKTIIEEQNRQLLSSNYYLNAELDVKNTDLQKANESLQRVNEELDNFIYKTSHDIRGPLASLKGMCNVALMDVKDPIALNYLKKLDITAEKLNTILTRLLIVNQINNSVLGKDPIDFESIVNDVLLLERKKGLPPRLTINTHIESDIDYYSDKEFVRIILENLIDNAIKFYNDSQRIEPFVNIVISTEDRFVKIRVVDNGIGISEVHPDKIFQMFSRASERSETGGIGLYITKTATEKLGGTVNLKTTPEGYTEFFVRLPLAMNRVLV